MAPSYTSGAPRCTGDGSFTAAWLLGIMRSVEIALEITVRSTDLDELGHVNNAKFVEYLEWGRFEWYDQTKGAEALAREPGRLGFVVVRIEADYLAEARRGDSLVVTTRLKAVGRKSLALQQVIRTHGGKLVCRAEVVVVLFDLVARCGVPFSPELRAALLPLVGEAAPKG